MFDLFLLGIHILYKIMFLFIYPIGGTLTDTIIPGQSGPRCNGDEGVLHIPQGSITGTSPLDAV